MTLGFLQVDVTFRGDSHKLELLIVSSFYQRQILGLDFCKSFSLTPDILHCPKTHLSDRPSALSPPRAS